jgi:hypothetical protein
MTITPPSMVKQSAPLTRRCWVEHRNASDDSNTATTATAGHGQTPSPASTATNPAKSKPTTELVLSHKHPDDLADVKGLLRQSEAPFGSRHRIRTTTGDIRNVVVVGDAVTDADGRITATRGFYVDITAAFNADLQHSITNELQVIVPQREIIEQAKGMLMVTYQISADAAFGILRWRSQEHNVKLAIIAERLVADLPVLHSGHPALRAPVDHYLMTLATRNGRPNPS